MNAVSALFALVAAFVLGFLPSGHAHGAEPRQVEVRLVADRGESPHVDAAPSEATDDSLDADQESDEEPDEDGGDEVAHAGQPAHGYGSTWRAWSRELVGSPQRDAPPHLEVERVWASDPHLVAADPRGPPTV